VKIEETVGGQTVEMAVDVAPGKDQTVVVTGALLQDQKAILHRHRSAAERILARVKDGIPVAAGQRVKRSLLNSGIVAVNGLKVMVVELRSKRKIRSEALVLKMNPNQKSRNQEEKLALKEDQEKTQIEDRGKTQIEDRGKIQTEDRGKIQTGDRGKTLTEDQEKTLTEDHEKTQKEDPGKTLRENQGKIRRGKERKRREY